ncbi:hypothetical protein Daus18300_001933 [Diaporthe australafricana]|uniref:Uncharacterized protein n=1 Tax=Diaporthe australafricana TaxID=127596 RepID=A0ABR3XRS9_9PEZI
MGPKRNRVANSDSPTHGGPSTLKKAKVEDLDSAPFTPNSSGEREQKQSQPCATATNDDILNPTGNDTPRPIILHGDKIHDDGWLAGYLGFNNKFLLRSLALSPLVLRWAVEQNAFNWKPAEISAAISILSENEAHGDEDTKLDLRAFGNPKLINEEYVLPHQKGTNEADRKLVPTAKRVEALVRILITVREELDCLNGERDHDQFRECYNIHRATTEEYIREINDMPFFVLPDIPLDRLQAPALGPLGFKGRKEHVVEKWVRILTLLQYANGRVSKSKHTRSGCIGGSLGVSDAQRSQLSEEARRSLVDKSATKWLGLHEDWSVKILDPRAIPAWMRPEPMDRRRRIKGKDPNIRERRPIKFEAVWLEDYPGEAPDLGPRCRQFWADEGFRSQFGIMEHDKRPDFAETGNSPKVRDPRDFPDYPYWRDYLRAELYFTDWKLGFQSAYLIDRKITKNCVSADLLPHGAGQREAGEEPKCVRIYDASGKEPRLGYHDFLAEVEKGHDIQTIAFICEPLNDPEIRHFPWETALFLTGMIDEPIFTDNTEAERLSPAVEKDSEPERVVQGEPERANADENESEQVPVAHGEHTL